MPWKCPKGCDIKYVCCGQAEYCVGEYSLDDRNLEEGDNWDFVEVLKQEKLPTCPLCAEDCEWEDECQDTKSS